MTLQRTLTTAILIAGSAALIGCQSNYRAHAKKITNSYAAGNYQEAADIAVAGATKKHDDETERVIYNLEAARTAQVAGNPRISRAYYDAVYSDTRPYLDTKAEDKVTEALATTAVNQAMATYKGTPPERIMCHSLNAINCLALGDRDAARVELRLAQDWQDDAKNRYAAEIEAAQQAAKEQAEEDGVGDAVSDDIPDCLAEHYTNLEDLRGHEDFQNPFASHLRGVYLMACGVDAADRDGARFELRQVAATNPDSRPALEEDLVILNNPQLWTQPPTTWVYFMTGRAPHLEELRLDIPIPLGNVNYVSAAFPQLQPNDDHVQHLTVATSNVQGVRASPLCDMDGVVGSEFSVRLPTIVAQEIGSSAAKAAATWAAGEAAGSYGQLAGMIYQAASTSADLRSWRTLPKQIHVCRVPTPEDARVHITADGSREFGDIGVVSGECNLVVVTLPSAQAPSPAVVSIQLTGDVPNLTKPIIADTGTTTETVQ